LIDYAFGENSFQRHIQLSREAGVEPKIYESDRLSLDIDLPDDLNRYHDVVGGLGDTTLDLAKLTP
jgi:2-phospho-L-lactate guanylyltransferase (CobY/MobA/RfbA family)